LQINQSFYLVESRRHAIVVATDTQETQGQVASTYSDP